MEDINADNYMNSKGSSTPFCLPDSIDPPKCLSDLSKVLRAFSSNVEACGSILKHYVPDFVSKEIEWEISKPVKSYNMEILERVSSLIPNLFILPKEALYYIACRIMQEKLSVIETLQFTLRPEYRRKVMEPSPCSVRYHEFVEGIRCRITLLATMSEEEGKNRILNTRQWLSLHLPIMILMAQEVILEHSIVNYGPPYHDQRAILDTASLKSSLILHQIEKGTNAKLKHIAFSIMDSSFIDLLKIIKGGPPPKIKYAKEIYHFDDTNNLKWREEGKEREAKIVYFESLEASLNPERKEDGVNISSYLNNHSYNVFLKEKKKNRDSIVAFHFDALKRDLKSIIELADSTHTISASQLSNIARTIMELTWAEFTVIYDSFSRREYKIAKTNSMLNKIPEEALYYFANALCKLSNPFEAKSFLLSLHDIEFPIEYSDNSPKKQYASFLEELGNILRNNTQEQDIVDFIQMRFISMLNTGMDACMWEYYRKQRCIEFANEILSCKGTDAIYIAKQEQIVQLALSIHAVGRILELPPIVEAATLEYETKNGIRFADYKSRRGHGTSMIIFDEFM